MASGRRIKLQPNCPIDPGEEVQFRFEGRTVSGFTHEPVASALLASGIKIFGRSIKYHRPRGPLCMHGHCSGCLVRIDGVPNLRACEIPCRSGMVVERQGGWPGAGFDFFRAVDWLASDSLDHHGMFTASSTLNRVAARFIRKLSGQGEVPTADQPGTVQFERFAAPVVVVGGGASGLVAATTIAGCGHRVVLFDKERHLGGRLLDGSSGLSATENEWQRGWDFLARCQKELEESQGIEIHSNTPVLAIYPGERFQVLASNESESFEIDAARLVICAGAYEQVPLMPNNDLPGIFSLRALDRLVSGYGSVPGEPVALVGDSDDCLRLGGLLADAGVAVAGVVTRQRDDELIGLLKRRDIPVYFDRQVVRARGGKWLDRLEFAPLDSADPETYSNLVLDCQVCAIQAPSAPAYELAHHAGCRVNFSSQSGYQVATGPEGQSSHAHLFAAGSCTGTTGLTEAVRQGERAGLACSLSLKDNPAVAKRLKALMSA